MRQSGRTVASRLVLAEHILSGPKVILIWRARECLRVTVERVHPGDHDAPMYFEDENGEILPPAAQPPQGRPAARSEASERREPSGSEEPTGRTAGRTDKK